MSEDKCIKQGININIEQDPLTEEVYIKNKEANCTGDSLAVTYSYVTSEAKCEVKTKFGSETKPEDDPETEISDMAYGLLAPRFDNIGECGVSEAAARAGLYAGHQVKDEMVLGPEVYSYVALDERREECGGSVQLITSTLEHTQAQNVYTCDACNKQFNKEIKLFNHMQVHTVKKPYAAAYAWRTVAQRLKRSNSNHDKTTHLVRPHKTLVNIEDMNEYLQQRKYVCSICMQRFKMETSLNRHIRAYHSDKMYACTQSGQQLTNEDDLNQNGDTHLQKKHYVCECKKQYTLKSNLNRHKRTHHNENKRVSTRLNRQRRIQTTRNEQKDDFNQHAEINLQEEPSVCGNKLKSGLIRNEQIHNNEQTDARTEASGQIEPKNDLNHRAILLQNEPKACISNKEDKLKSRLIQNEKIHHNDKTDACAEESGQRLTNKDDLDQHGEKEEKTHVCNICKRGFKLKSSLMRHQRTHNDENKAESYVCKCKKVFQYKSSFIRHVRKRHNTKPYICKMCPRRFKTLHNLNAHKAIHLQKRPMSYVCDECKISFTLKRNLVQHIKLHNGDKPYICRTCGHRCARKSHLKQHEATHSQTKPFVCDTCNKGYVVKNRLIDHIRTHTGSDKAYASTQESGQRLTNIDDLDQHGGKEEKTHVCNICKRSFKAKSSLMRHQRKHSVENKAESYVCKCKKVFQYKSSFIRHIRTLHNIKPQNVSTTFDHDT